MMYARGPTPRRWQSELEHMLGSIPDDRQVRFYVDREGGAGRSWFIGWFKSKYPVSTQLLPLDGLEDLTFAIDPSKRIFFFNVPRGGMGSFPYEILEQLKDGLVMSIGSHGYPHEMKAIKSCHVVVFSHEFPDTDSMSTDRYNQVDMSLLSQVSVANYEA
jgi:hypothetical protein